MHIPENSISVQLMLNTRIIFKDILKVRENFDEIEFSYKKFNQCQIFCDSTIEISIRISVILVILSSSVTWKKW